MFVYIQIIDDGKGIDNTDQTTHEKTFGVFGMQERAAMLGGEMSISSQPNEGTTIRVNLPLKYNE